MNIDVNVKIDLADRIYAVITDFAGRPLPFVAGVPQAVNVPAAQAAPAVSDPSADTGTAEPEKAKETKPRGRPKKEAAPVAEPAAPAPEEAAQDAADEAAEAAAAAPEPTPEATPTYTLDDVRQELGAYAKAYGMDFAMSDCPKIMGFEKASAVPAESFADVIGKLRAGIANNPFGREKAA